MIFLIMMKGLLQRHWRGFATTFIHNEYKFYVDFKGLLYFDDGTPFVYPNCVKDHKFINELYKKLEAREGDYPFEATFWGERNFVRCAISPVIFHSLEEGNLRFSFQQSVPFNPQALSIDREGRIWHPFRDQIKGVFSNDLLVHVLEGVSTVDGASYLDYEGTKYEIKAEL